MERDAVIVGARCSGSTLGAALVRRGWEVLLVDRATFPSDTVSTHLIFPNTLARFHQLGILDTFLAAHELALMDFRLIGLGHSFAGGFTPIDGFDRCAAPRRVALDKAILDTALAAGAEGRFGERVVDLIGSGTTEDPVAGVVLESGERIGAKWVFGADGRASTVAGRLGIEKTGTRQGETAFLLGYWRGLPDDGFATSEIRRDEILSRWAGEDGATLITAWGDAEFTRGSQEERRRRYHEALSRFPETVDLEELKAAEMISDVVVAPESMMRGCFRVPPVPAGRCSVTPATSSTPRPRRGSPMPSSRLSSLPRRSPKGTEISTATRAGATTGLASTTRGPTIGGASPPLAPR